MKKIEGLSFGIHASTTPLKDIVKGVPASVNQGVAQHKMKRARTMTTKKSKGKKAKQAEAVQEEKEVPRYTIEMAEEAVRTGVLRDCPFRGKTIDIAAAALLARPEAQAAIHTAVVCGGDPHCGLGYLKFCPNLNALHLRILEFIVLCALQGSTVTELVVSNTNEIILPDLKHLGYLKKLSRLVLDKTNMTDEALLLLEPFMTLTHVYVHGCPGVTLDGVKALQALRKDMQVVM